MIQDFTIKFNPDRNLYLSFDLVCFMVCVEIIVVASYIYVAKSLTHNKLHMNTVFSDGIS